MPNDVIIIRGAPGSGKSSVARHVTRRLTSGATLEVDVLRRTIHGICWEDHDVHLEAIYAAMGAAHRYLDRGRSPIVFVDTLGFGRLELVLAALGSMPTGVHSLVCRDPQLTIRLGLRVSGYRNVRDARRFNKHIAADPVRQETIIDTTWARPGTIAKQILEREGWIA